MNIMASKRVRILLLLFLCCFILISAMPVFADSNGNRTNDYFLYAKKNPLLDFLRALGGNPGNGRNPGNRPQQSQQPIMTPAATPARSQTGTPTAVPNRGRNTPTASAIASTSNPVMPHVDPGRCKHEWKDGQVTVRRTCTSEGKKTYTCKICGITKVETLSPLGHNWGEWKEFEDDGGARIMKRVCTRCGKEETRKPNLSLSMEILDSYFDDNNKLNLRVELINSGDKPVGHISCEIEIGDSSLHEEFITGVIAPKERSTFVIIYEDLTIEDLSMFSERDILNALAKGVTSDDKDFVCSDLVPFHLTFPELNNAEQTLVLELLSIEKRTIFAPVMEITGRLRITNTGTSLTFVNAYRILDKNGNIAPQDYLDDFPCENLPIGPNENFDVSFHVLLKDEDDLTDEAVRSFIMLGYAVSDISSSDYLVKSNTVIAQLNTAVPLTVELQNYLHIDDLSISVSGNMIPGSVINGTLQVSNMGDLPVDITGYRILDGYGNLCTNDYLDDFSPQKSSLQPGGHASVQLHAFLSENEANSNEIIRSIVLNGNIMLKDDSEQKKTISNEAVCKFNKTDQQSEPADSSLCIDLLSMVSDDPIESGSLIKCVLRVMNDGQEPLTVFAGKIYDENACAHDDYFAFFPREASSLAEEETCIIDCFVTVTDEDFARGELVRTFQLVAYTIPRGDEIEETIYSDFVLGKILLV